MFVDKVEISIKAGNGGNGAVTFHREKYVKPEVPTAAMVEKAAISFLSLTIIFPH